MPIIYYNCLEVLECDEKDKSRVFDALKGNYQNGEPTLFDFNQVIPMPMAFQKEVFSIVRYNDVRNKYERDVLEGTRGIANTVSEKDLPEMRLYGKLQNWYEWSIANWGVKWNAGDVKYDKDDLLFTTANGVPFPVVAMLSQKHPKLQFRLTYANEDDSKMGFALFKNGLAKDHKETLVEKTDIVQTKRIHQLVRKRTYEEAVESLVENHLKKNKRQKITKENE
jgi:hypothetical protein